LPPIRKRRHIRRAISMYRSLREAGIIQEAGVFDTSGGLPQYTPSSLQV